MPSGSSMPSCPQELAAPKQKALFILQDKKRRCIRTLQVLPLAFLHVSQVPQETLMPATAAQMRTGARQAARARFFLESADT
jgi:hypothetical protein